MLQSIKHLYRETLRASDGDIGHVKDFYFDDTNWAVRYVVADTGSWLSGRQVLLAPHAFGPLYQDGKILLVNLNRKQIENSPSIALHKPVSRQYEGEYYQYYGWPTVGDINQNGRCLWVGGELKGRYDLALVRFTSLNSIRRIAAGPRIGKCIR
jgi:hypothetical protein